MPNPSGISGPLFVPTPSFGDVAKQRDLLHAAPISGAPVANPAPGPQPMPQPAQAAPPGGGVPAPAPIHESATYYRQLANTWRVLAKVKGASDLVRHIAKQAETYARKVEAGEV